MTQETTPRLAHEFSFPASGQDFQAWLLRQQIRENAGAALDGAALSKDKEADNWAELVATVSQQQLDDFRVELEAYQAATTEELLYLREQLDRLESERQELLDKAYVLPDGRRVFKSEDGTKVYFEDGTEVDPSIVQHHQIGEEHTYWQPYHRKTMQVDIVKQHFDATLSYQHKTDALEQRLERGEITEGEYGEMRETLVGQAPKRVSARVNGQAPELDLNITDMKSGFSAAAKSLGLASQDADGPALTQ